MIYLYLMLCNFLFIPFIFCSDATGSKLNKTATNNTASVSQSLNETKAPLETEGGELLPETLAMAFPKENPGIENEMGKSRIVPRKEAILDVTKSEEKSSSNYEISSIKPITSVEKSKSMSEQLNNKTNSVIAPTVSSTALNKTVEKNVTVPVKVPHKPLTLNAEALEKSITEVQPSSTYINNQIHSPNRDVKSYIHSSNAHPGMVMPIVITILLVPMFAVLGYMALRRGQEAWKNRHYKRMDFLLDGMYND